MKKLFSIVALCFCMQIASAQTRILDSYVNWTNGTLTVYLSDSLVTNVTVKIGTTFQSENVFDQSYTVGSSVQISDNTIVIPLTGVTPGAYYMDLRITPTAGSVQLMEFQTSN